MSRMVPLHAGSPFAAYAAAMPEDSAFSSRPKTLRDAQLDQALSEGRAVGLHGRTRGPLDTGTPEASRNCAAGASSFPLSLFRSAAMPPVHLRSHLSTASRVNSASDGRQG